MASMLLRATRDATRAASSPASAASRCAAVAVSGSGGAAASNWLLRRFPIVLRPFGRGLSSDCKFVADAKDLESDEALWNLYERWCEALGERRDHDEMLRRFSEFKESALLVDRVNKEAIRDAKSVRLRLNRFADGKRREELAPKVPIGMYRDMLPPDTKIFVRAGMDMKDEPYPFTPFPGMCSRRL